ncbi:class I SAM-dependent methyltransferase [Mycobacteroides abscessus]|uniref:class I SAM-dependent methyltransferase n=1 Tax=Mycobacteroides abscessus TaxID=36809 RepID=UPI0013F650C7|nr:methyltransferase domain-containing protein [Mycobacteroides abscessus]
MSADVAGRRWSRESPAPIPTSLRWALAIPRPSRALRSTLQARPGERILEIGPGLGQQAVQVAQWIGPEGRMHVVDLQQQMVDATTARARKHNITIEAHLGDTSGQLPFDDGYFDAAYLSSVLGEIPEAEGMLAELYRVLRPHGRLVVTENAIDPDFVPPERLCRLAKSAGFAFETRSGPFFAYYARFLKQ